jgi:uncharacterized membrane protein
MNQNNAVVAIYKTHTEAEAAVKQLQESGFDMKKLSIVGRDYHTEEHAVGFYNAGDRVKYWGKLGVFWGGVFGIFLAPAFFWIPGIGPILTGGIIGSMLMGTLEGAAVGAAVIGGTTALAVSLASMGIPKDSIIHYESAIKANKFLLIASGSPAEVERARETLAERGGDVKLHAR